MLEGQNFVRYGTADLGGNFELILGGVHDTSTGQCGDCAATEHLLQKQTNGAENLVLGLY